MLKESNNCAKGREFIFLEKKYLYSQILFLNSFAEKDVGGRTQRKQFLYSFLNYKRYRIVSAALSVFVMHLCVLFSCNYIKKIIVPPFQRGNLWTRLKSNLDLVRER